MILIDVRTKAEYETNHIDGAIHHDVMDMQNGFIPNIDKNLEIIVYCASGGRSMLAKKILEKYEFKKVSDAGSIDNLRK